MFNLKPRAQKKATIIDVASQAGVAVGTVSRYLNGETLRKSNRERIEFAISELHFKRNLNAVAMRSTQAKFVGFILPHFDEFHVGILNHLTQALKREGFVILPYIHGSENIHLADARDYFQEHRIDLLITSGDINFASQSEILEDMGVPVILYSNDALGLDVDRVLIQDLKASEAAVNHLIDMGHKNIGILRGNMGDTTAQDRFAGYVQALKNHDLNFDEKTQCAAEGWHETDGYSGTHALLSGSHPPTAIFCSNHLQARGAIRYLSEHNIKIGEDISILSFGDSEYFPYIANGISAVRLPDAEIAKTLSDFTISRLNRENTPFRRTITAQCDLVIRGSVAKLEASK